MPQTRAKTWIDERPGAQPGRRRTARIRTLKGARIRVSGGLPIRCIVRDISTSGARIERRGPVMSDFFRLSFDDVAWPQDIPCVVVWRDNDAIGVQFEGPFAFPANLLTAAAN